MLSNVTDNPIWWGSLQQIILPDCVFLWLSGLLPDFWHLFPLNFFFFLNLVIKNQQFIFFFSSCPIFYFSCRRCPIFPLILALPASSSSTSFTEAKFQVWFTLWYPACPVSLVPLLLLTPGCFWILFTILLCSLAMRAPLATTPYPPLLFFGVARIRSTSSATPVRESAGHKISREIYFREGRRKTI